MTERAATGAGRPPVRRAGRWRLEDGSEVLWSVAEGRRGRRWRSSVWRKGACVQSLLLEAARSGRPGRLEVVAPAGLLTLHPDAGDASAHGNVVGRDGVRSLAHGWSPEHGIVVERDPIPTLVLLARLAESVGVEDQASLPVLAVAEDLRVEEGTLVVRRLTVDTWRLGAGDTTRESTLIVGEDGLPGGPGTVEWALEADERS
ncbi:MAG TPA: hypothetical protein VIV06_02820 [Candidatus Limnocylindrales bacterium]